MQTAINSWLLIVYLPKEPEKCLAMREALQWCIFKLKNNHMNIFLQKSINSSEISVFNLQVRSATVEIFLALTNESLL